MAKILMAVLITLGIGTAWAAEGGGMFQFNDKRFTPAHAYAYRMQTPDFDAMTPADMQAGKLKWKESLAVALSDRPFDRAALASLDAPEEALDRMAQAGALVVTVVAGRAGKVDAVRVALPGGGRILQPDAAAATLTLDPPKTGLVSGRLVIKGDRKMHEFDPANVPFIEADVRFQTAAPAR